MTPFITKAERLDLLLARIEPDLNSGCWLWTGPLSNGYGRTSLSGHSIGAHRASWLLHGGDLPPGLHVCHRCDVRPCINPGHLFLGTAADNIADMIAKGRFYIRRGAELPYTRLNEEAVREIRIAASRGMAWQTIGDAYGIRPNTVRAVAAGRRWGRVQ